MITDINGLINNIIKQIQEFTDIAVIGLSGGADSALVAILCTKALGNNNVYGIHMPATETDLKTFNTDSRKLAKHLNINDAIIPLAGTVRLLQDTIHLNLWKGAQNHNPSNLAKGNMRARIRMTTLYTIAELLSDTFNKKVRVIGTDNLTENFLGYFTKYGDGGVDINPIGELFKSEIYQLLDYFKEQGIIEECHINRIPSAGLWEGQTDEGELGFTYKEIEECIKEYYNNEFWDMQDVLEGKSECYKFIFKLNEMTSHKRKMPSNLRIREFCDWIGYEL
ncbi:MAG: NAD(+) synthase [Clostridia bacterium]